ncbi:ABC transporter substrate-binding protein [Frigoribacterium faeni]|uniref:Peptide ABC transporter substrate-binding protein n=1 Tax=Frigoribacterium faeni TaxID=145483 RepID=A0A7W3PH03_9MICO|nr:ABC transporter substrate-binding protein [Frigoribacterium faeni]MBA8811785.1 peptide/nickel transport system substrate-binding protein [Frigoribacterium faeni]BFF12761.1 ABC transporter substrate-binding protein [Microbacterium flavescens]GEK83271.1 peptide ABC transporter substrate-binding protein [Frigoribacterium faeni]
MSARPLVATALTALAALTLTACASGGGASADSINATLGTDPGGFDPALARAADDYYVDRMLFDTLLRKDDDNQLVGGLATEWEATSASSYTFTIRDGATCSDGTEITPTIVADSLSRFADPETASTGRTLAMGGATADITADDAAGTVAVQLSDDWSDFLTGMTLPHTGIVCPAGLADPEGLLAGTVDGAFSGPYTLTDAQPAVSYELTLRDDYDAWPEFSTPVEGTPAQTVTFTPIADQATQATQLLSGGIDVASFSGEDVERFDGDDAYTQSSVTGLTSYLVFNEREGSVFADDPELRAAVAQAVDPAAFADVLTNGRGDTIASVSSDSVACVNTDDSLLAGYDADAASAVLDGVSIHLVGTQLFGPGNEYVAEVLRAAGADVSYDELDNANWSTTTGSPTGWDMTVQGDINLMGTLTSSLLRVMGPSQEDGGRNKMGLVNETGYSALNEAMSIVDPAAQCEPMQAAQTSMLENVDAAPLASVPTTVVTAEGVSIRTFDDYIDPSTMRIVE